MRHNKTIIASVVILGTTVCSSPASATFEVTTHQCGEGIPTLCIESGGKLFEAKGTESYSGKLVASTEALFSVSLGEEVHIACTADHSTGNVEQTEPLVHAVVSKNGVLTFSGCRLLEPLSKKCKVPAEIKTNMLTGTVTDEMPISAGVVSAELGTIIVEIPFTNSGTETCPATIKGTQPVTGSDLCIAAESEVDKVSHAGECTAEGSKLKLGGSAAVFEAKSEVELIGGSKGKSWDVSLG